MIKGSGGGLSVGGDGANKIIAKIAESAEQAKGAAEATSEAVKVPSKDRKLIVDTVNKPPLVLGRDSKTGNPNHYKKSEQNKIKAKNSNDPDTIRTTNYATP